MYNPIDDSYALELRRKYANLKDLCVFVECNALGCTKKSTVCIIEQTLKGRKLRQYCRNCYRKILKRDYCINS